MVRRIRAAVSAAALCLSIGLALATPLAAAPKVSRSVTYYDLSATTIPGLRQEMAGKGPKGVWGYTEWYVRWTATCQLSVDIAYTLPRHRNPGSLDPATRKSLAAMIAALTRHEEGHGAFGIAAATEIGKAGCRNAQAILGKYLAAEKAYDRTTAHGRREGVVLK